MSSHRHEMPYLGLSPHDQSELRRILAQHLSSYTVWAFGSRVAGTAKPFSDLDLVIVTEQPLTLKSMATIKDAFDESDMTIRVDVVDWAATSIAFRKIIEQHYVVIQGKPEAEAIKSP
jgi:predicted nucleotidyltransferase